MTRRATAQSGERPAASSARKPAAKRHGASPSAPGNTATALSHRFDQILYEQFLERLCTHLERTARGGKPFLLGMEPMPDGRLHLVMIAGDERLQTVANVDASQLGSARVGYVDRECALDFIYAWLGMSEGPFWPLQASPSRPTAGQGAHSARELARYTLLPDYSLARHLVVELMRIAFDGGSLSVSVGPASAGGLWFTMQAGKRKACAPSMGEHGETLDKAYRATLDQHAAISLLAAWLTTLVTRFRRQQSAGHALRAAESEAVCLWDALQEHLAEIHQNTSHGGQAGREAAEAKLQAEFEGLVLRLLGIWPQDAGEK